MAACCTYRQAAALLHIAGRSLSLPRPKRPILGRWTAACSYSSDAAHAKAVHCYAHGWHLGVWQAAGGRVRQGSKDKVRGGQRGLHLTFGSQLLTLVLDTRATQLRKLKKVPSKYCACFHVSGLFNIPIETFSVSRTKGLWPNECSSTSHSGFVEFHPHDCDRH